MECYSLPFGGLGFVSHIITYYTIIVLGSGRSPLLPWKSLKYSWFNLCLSLVGLMGGFAIAVFTLVACRNHWQFLVIGIWKLSMSVVNGAVGIHAATLVRRFSKTQRSRQGSSSSKSYLPLSRVDDDETTSRNGSTTEPSTNVMRSSRASVMKETREKEEERTSGVEEKPITQPVFTWIILCKFSVVSPIYESNDALCQKIFQA
jgi:hypothetical protein